MEYQMQQYSRTRADNHPAFLRAISERTCRYCQRRALALNDQYPRTCPACGKPADYTADLDRFIHSDGSGNAQCWAQMTSGQIAI